MSASTRNAQRPDPDAELVAIADYVSGTAIDSSEAYSTARYCLMDSLACAMMALGYPACTKLLGPVVPGAEMRDGVVVPGTPYRLDPVQGAFNIGAMIRWLDFNDTWLAAEWGHPSDNLGGILAAADYESRSYVMEHVLFKIAYPAEFHAQTAVEAAMQLHAEVAPRLDEVDRVVIETQEAGVRIIDKTGPLSNPADRDHCIQYMVAVPLIFGRLTAADYEDAVAADPRIDALRERMAVTEHEPFSRDYLDPEKRSIGNAVQVFFQDGSKTERVAVEYPIGHRRRREEGIPLLEDKFHAALAERFAPRQANAIAAAVADQRGLEAMPVHAFMDLWRH